VCSALCSRKYHNQYATPFFRQFAGFDATSGTATGQGANARCELAESAASAALQSTTATSTFADYAATLVDKDCDKAVTTPATFTWTVPASAPDVLYYHCLTHLNLGYQIRVFDAGAVDVAIAAALQFAEPPPSSCTYESTSPSTPTPTPTPTAGNRDGLAAGNGESMTGVTVGDITLSYTIDAAASTIRITASGAVSSATDAWLGFGLSETGNMVGSRPALGWITSDLDCYIEMFELAGRSNSAVNAISSPSLVSNRSCAHVNGRLTLSWTQPLDVGGGLAIDGGSDAANNVVYGTGSGRWCKCFRDVYFCSLL
jgi:hypothetical protein